MARPEDFRVGDFVIRSDGVVIGRVVERGADFVMVDTGTGQPVSLDATSLENTTVADAATAAELSAEQGEDGAPTVPTAAERPPAIPTPVLTPNLTGAPTRLPGGETPILPTTGVGGDSIRDRIRVVKEKLVAQGRLRNEVEELAWINRQEEIFDLTTTETMEANLAAIEIELADESLGVGERPLSTASVNDALARAELADPTTQNAVRLGAESRAIDQRGRAFQSFSKTFDAHIDALELDARSNPATVEAADIAEFIEEMNGSEEDIFRLYQTWVETELSDAAKFTTGAGEIVATMGASEWFKANGNVIFKTIRPDIDVDDESLQGFKTNFTATSRQLVREARIDFDIRADGQREIDTFEERVFNLSRTEDPGSQSAIRLLESLATEAPNILNRAVNQGFQGAELGLAVNTNLSALLQQAIAADPELADIVLDSPFAQVNLDRVVLAKAEAQAKRDVAKAEAEARAEEPGEAREVLFEQAADAISASLPPSQRLAFVSARGELGREYARQAEIDPELTPEEFLGIGGGFAGAAEEALALPGEVGAIQLQRQLEPIEGGGFRFGDGPQPTTFGGVAGGLFAPESAEARVALADRLNALLAPANQENITLEGLRNALLGQVGVPISQGARFGVGRQARINERFRFITDPFQQQIFAQSPRGTEAAGLAGVPAEGALTPEQIQNVTQFISQGELGFQETQTLEAQATFAEGARIASEAQARGQQVSQSRVRFRR